MLNRKMIILTILTILISITSTSWADPNYWYVDPDGDDSTGTSWATAFETINQGISAADTGDVVEVNEGTYFGDWDAGQSPNCNSYANTIWIPPINPQDKDIIITSTDPDDPDVVANTKISGWWPGHSNPLEDCRPDANGWLQACKFENGETSDCEIKGFTIFSGQNSYVIPQEPVICAAIECTNGTFPTITKCVFPTNDNEEYVEGNDKLEITAILCESTSSGSMKIQDCIFSGLDGGSFDSVIEIKGASGAEIVNCTIENNDTFSFGVYCINDGSDYPGNVTVKNSTITGCPIGLRYNGDSTLTISDYCYIVDNDDQGIYFDGSNGGSINVSNCNISGNGDNSKDGGGIYIFDDDSASSVISNCIFEDNNGDSGGGLAVEESSSLDIKNSVFQGNTASDDGGGIRNKDSFIDVTGCTFIGNSAGDFGGGGIYTYASSSGSGYADTDIDNCIFWNNIAEPDGDQIGLDGSQAEVSVDYSNVQGGPNDVKDPSENLDWGVGNIGYHEVEDDPLFVTDDFHLTSGSPCFNAGDPNGDYSGQTDIDGDFRVMGGRIEMGADELLLCPGDVTGTVTGWVVGGPPLFINYFDISLWQGSSGTFNSTDVQALNYLLNDEGGSVSPVPAEALAGDVTGTVSGWVNGPPPDFINYFDKTLWEGPNGTLNSTDVQALIYLLTDEGGSYTCP